MPCSEVTSGFLSGVDSRIAEEDPQPNRGILKGHPVGWVESVGREENHAKKVMERMMILKSQHYRLLLLLPPKSEHVETLYKIKIWMRKENKGIHVYLAC